MSFARQISFVKNVNFKYKSKNTTHKTQSEFFLSFSQNTLIALGLFYNRRKVRDVNRICVATMK